MAALHPMFTAEPIGMGVYIHCHGECHPETIRKVPPGVIVMKKNFSRCGIISPGTLKYRDSSETPEVIVEELTRSFSPAFTPDRCGATNWHGQIKEKPGFAITKSGREVDLRDFTCEEFNTHEGNKTDYFVYKIYTADEMTHCILFSVGGITIDLLRAGIEEILSVYRIGSDPRDPRHTQIQEVIGYLISNISYRNQVASETAYLSITTDFIFHLAKLIELVHGINVIRILDESCNEGIREQPIAIDGKLAGFGGKRKSRQKNKRRKSKKHH
jgi:hypothetical protein